MVTLFLWQFIFLSVEVVVKHAVFSHCFCNPFTHPFYYLSYLLIFFSILYIFLNCDVNNVLNQKHAWTVACTAGEYNENPLRPAIPVVTSWWSLFSISISCFTIPRTYGLWRCRFSKRPVDTDNLHCILDPLLRNSCEGSNTISHKDSFIQVWRRDHWQQNYSFSTHERNQ